MGWSAEMINFPFVLTALVKVRRVVSLKKLPNSVVVLGQVCVGKIELNHLHLTIVPFCYYINFLAMLDMLPYF